MAEKKITKKDNFMEIRALIVKAEMLEDSKKEQYLAFIDHELELLDKKASSKSSSKNTKEQEELMIKIVKALQEIGEPVTISDLQKKNEEMSEYSNQKLSAMLKKLVDNKQVTKIVDKKKSYFTTAETPEVEGE